MSETPGNGVFQPIDQKQPFSCNTEVRVHDICHANTGGTVAGGQQAITDEHHYPVKAPFGAESKHQETSGDEDSRNYKQDESRLSAEDTIVFAGPAPCPSIGQGSADICANEVAYDCWNIDQPVQTRGPVVWCRLKDKRGDRVGTNLPSKTQRVCTQKSTLWSMLYSS